MTLEEMQRMIQQQAGPGVPGMVAPGGGPTLGQPPMGGAPPMGGPPGPGPMPQPAGMPGPQMPAPSNPTTPAPWATAGPKPGGMAPQDQAMMDLFSRLGKLQPEQAQLARQRAQVEGLRAGGKTPGMRTAGGVTQAAHPLEFLGSLAHQGVGAYKEHGANQMEDQLMGKRAGHFADWRKTQGFDRDPPRFDPQAGQ